MDINSLRKQLLRLYRYQSFIVVHCYISTRHVDSILSEKSRINACHLGKYFGMSTATTFF